MGLLDLMRLMAMQRQRRRRRHPQAPCARDELISSRAASPCQRDDDSQCGEIKMDSGPSLPEEVWCHIHSLMPMRDAARAACVSRAFLCSWRHHPELIFDSKTLVLDKNACGNNEAATYFSSKVDQILKKHSGIGVKRLMIQFENYNAKDSCHLDHWLQIAVTPGIEELMLSLPFNSKYNFPYTLLCNGSGDSIQSFHLSCCSFSPTAELGWLRRLTRLYLYEVRIRSSKLEQLLSNSFALEHLNISWCNGIVSLKVPCLLQRLSHLELTSCENLRMIDIEAPNISNLFILLDLVLQISLRENLQMKDLCMFFKGAVYYACELLPSVPNLETLSISSNKEEVANAPMLHSKFLHLKKLNIRIRGGAFSPFYDYFSLISFLDACPSLEAFVLDVSQENMEHVSVFADDSDLRQKQEHYHHKIKRVEILGFSSAKSLVELAGHVAKSMVSLECLTLDASPCPDFAKCYYPENKSGKCYPVTMRELMEACRGLSAIRKYIEPKVPSMVKLHVVEPCSKCHDVQALKSRVINC